MKIAIPSMSPGGLNSEMSEHFGRADVFTLIDTEGKKIVTTSVLKNPPHTQGGCLVPVHLLKENSVNAIIVGGLGVRPLMGFKQVGIRVIAGASGTVKSVVNAYLAGELAVAGDEVVCNHSKDSNCQH